MARAGARVVISSRKAENCEEVAQALRDEGLDASPIPCHIGKKEDLQTLADEARKRYGQIDILVCNAPVNPYYGPMAGLPDDAFTKILDSNIRSNLWLCNMVLPEMAQRRDGSVIIVSSIGGLKGSAVLGAYGISKAADMQLARSLAYPSSREYLSRARH